MTKTTQNNINLSDLSHYEFIRYEAIDNNMSFFLVADENERHDDDDCCHLNGHLYKLKFSNVTDLQITGKEADSYIYDSVQIKDRRIVLKLKGINYLTTNSTLEISFGFNEYQIEDLGSIKEAEA